MYELQYRVFGNDEAAVVQTSESPKELDKTLDRVREIVNATFGFLAEVSGDNHQVTILIKAEDSRDGSGWDEVSSYRIVLVEGQEETA